jgi:hypothetical protein
MQRFGSGARSAWIQSIRMFLSIVDLDPSINKQKVKKILYDFFS